MLVPRWQSAAKGSVVATGRGEPAGAATRDILEEDTLDRVGGAEGENLLPGRFDEFP